MKKCIPQAPFAPGTRFSQRGYACTVSKVQRCGRGWRITYQHADGRRYTESLTRFMRFFEPVQVAR